MPDSLGAAVSELSGRVPETTDLLRSEELGHLAALYDRVARQLRDAGRVDESSRVSMTAIELRLFATNNLVKF